MVVETEEPNGSKLVNLKLRNKPANDDTSGTSTAGGISTDNAAVAEEDLSKPRKTFGRTPDGTSNYPLLSLVLVTLWVV